MSYMQCPLVINLKKEHVTEIHFNVQNVFGDVLHGCKFIIGLNGLYALFRISLFVQILFRTQADFFYVLSSTMFDYFLSLNNLTTYINCYSHLQSNCLSTKLYCINDMMGALNPEIFNEFLSSVYEIFDFDFISLTKIFVTTLHCLFKLFGVFKHVFLFTINFFLLIEWDIVHSVFLFMGVQFFIYIIEKLSIFCTVFNAHNNSRTAIIFVQHKLFPIFQYLTLVNADSMVAKLYLSLSFFFFFFFFTLYLYLCQITDAIHCNFFFAGIVNLFRKYE